MQLFTDSLTQTQFVPQGGLWTGPSGAPSFIKRDFRFTADDIDTQQQGLWRYRKAIALPEHAEPVSLGEGFTPLCETRLYGQNVWVKQEYLFPTGSYKDRGATVLLSAAKTYGATHVLEDSSGNAGCAVAAYAAAAGIGCSIYVPEATSPAKIAQMELYGAHVHKIKGNRQDAAQAAIAAAQHQWFASHVYNPWFFEGTKTFAYELWEQCAELPDEILFPVGNGTLILGTYIGFGELLRSGLIPRIPALSLVQAENCAPLCGRSDFFPTKAEGIAVQAPARRQQIQEAVQQTGGHLYTVTEEEIVQARQEAASRGFFIEYTSAASVAILGKNRFTHRLLLPLTGHGLKNN